MTNEVWIIHPYALTPQMSGPTRAFDLAKKLVINKFKPRVIAPSFHYQKYVELKEYNKNELYKNEVIDGVHFTWVKTFPYQKNNYKRLFNWLDLSKKIYKINNFLLEKPKIIIGSSPHPFAALSSFYLANKLKVPFIFEFRDIWPDTLTEVFKLNSFHPLVLATHFITDKLYKEADHIISTLPLGEKKVLEEVPSRDKEDVTWIPNGVDADFFLQETYDNSKLNEEFDYLNSGDKFHVIYTGSLGNAYNLLSLIDAAYMAQKKAPEIHFTIVGNGVMRGEMEEKVSRLGLTNVTFHHPIEKRLIPVLLNTADLLYASFKESSVFSYGISMNKMQEYLLMAKPVVFACEVCGKNPVSISGAGKVANSSKAKTISDAIYKIYQLSEKEREEMGRKGREYVLEYFDTKKLGNKLIKILENFI